MSQALENLLTEDRKFEPITRVRSQGKSKARDPRGCSGGLSRLLASPGPTAHHLAQGANSSPGRLQPALLQVVRRRRAQHLLQLPRSSSGRARRPGGLSLGRRARRQTHADIPGPPLRSVPFRQRAAQPRRGERRPGRHLHGHGPRAPHRHAGLRSSRSGPLGCVRRVLLRRPLQPDPRRRCPGGHHPGRRVACRKRGPAQGQRRCGPGQHSGCQPRRRPEADRPRSRHDRGSGYLVARPGRGPIRRM